MQQEVIWTTSVPPDPFEVAELDVVLKNMKSGTTAGYDIILPEFLKRIGPRAKNCLTSFFNRIVQEKKITRACLDPRGTQNEASLFHQLQ